MGKKSAQKKIKKNDGVFGVVVERHPSRGVVAVLVNVFVFFGRDETTTSSSVVVVGFIVVVVVW